jgi:hypothetical protein
MKKTCHERKKREVICKMEKLQRKKVWQDFDKKRELCERNMRKKIQFYVECATQRNMKINQLIKLVANTIRDKLLIKVAELKKISIFQENMKMIASSQEEVNELITISQYQENNQMKWYNNIIEKEEKMIRQFENENLFYVNKKTWNIIQKEKIILKREGIIINHDYFNQMKQKIRQGSD